MSVLGISFGSPKPRKRAQHNESPLVQVGHIDIPEAVRFHRFYREAIGAAKLMGDKSCRNSRVVGTANSKQVELYGWGRDIDSHVDDTGFVYLVALDPGVSQVWVMPGDESTAVRVDIGPGMVIRLDDFVLHWTEDDHPRCAAFIGSYDLPEDEAAVAALRDAIALLAKGEYYGAPRVKEGFRAILSDECYVADDDFSAYSLALLADAKKNKRFVITCSHCDRPAIKVDHSWPYHSDYNACREHLKPDDVPEAA